MKALLNINLNNAAFEDNPSELADILESLAQKIRDEGYIEDMKIFLKDHNGNTVGKIRFNEDDN